ncbi:MAG: class I SAM-dependent RNA methyltransferase, partial [Oscillospiraceae bacterium]
MERSLQFAVPAPLGVESLVSYELKKLGLADVKAENGRVLCTGCARDIPRINLNLRTGARLLIVLGSFPARSFEELFQGAEALPWEDYIPREGRFPVKGYSLNSQLHAVPSCQAILKKAVAKRLGRVYGVQTLPETGAMYQIQFAIMKDQVDLMLDTSGENLYKRGYRAQGVTAPLRETLAAAMVSLSRYRGKDPFCDPFCGSGTIPIEAALIAKNRAPGLNRSFAAQKWAWLPSSLWMEAADEAMDQEYHGTYEIWGGDIDPAAVELSRHNAELAEVDDIVKFEVADATRFHWGGLR